MSKDVVVFKQSILGDDFVLPGKPDNSYKGTLTKIKNAWTNLTYVDEKGVLWISTDRMADILRTDKAKANYKLRVIPDDSKMYKDGHLFIRGYEIGKLIDQAIQEEGIGGRKQYLKYSEAIYKAIRDSDLVENIRTTYALQLQDSRKNLKSKRIKKYKITIDELTGDKLNKKEAEFSHIRSYALFKDISDDIENGLIVNKETHKIITDKNINDENELLELCKEQNWNISWYNKFKIYFLR